MRAAAVSATVEMNGIVGRLGGQIRQRRTQLGQDRIHQRGVGGDLHVDPTGETILPLHRGDHGIDLRGRSGDHGLARRGVHRPGSPRDSRRSTAAVASASSSSSATAPCPASRDISRERVAITRNPSATAQRAGHHRRGDLAHRMPDHRIRVHPVGAPQLGQRQLQPHQHRLHPRIPAAPVHRRRAPAAVRTRPARQTTGSNSATAAANAGSSASSCRPMPAHCEPCPE